MIGRYRKNPLPGHRLHALSDNELHAIVVDKAHPDTYEALVILHWRLEPPDACSR